MKTSTRLRTLGWIQIALLVVVALLVIRLMIVAGDTHDALCAFRGDLAARVASSSQYADDVRDGKRELILGVTLAEIDADIALRKRTLASLENLDC